MTSKLQESRAALSTEPRLRLFDQATARQLKSEKGVRKEGAARAQMRGWTREELYRRGFPNSKRAQPQ